MKTSKTSTLLIFLSIFLSLKAVGAEIKKSQGMKPTYEEFSKKMLRDFSEKIKRDHAQVPKQKGGRSLPVTVLDMPTEIVPGDTIEMNASGSINPDADPLQCGFYIIGSRPEPWLAKIVVQPCSQPLFFKIPLHSTTGYWQFSVTAFNAEGTGNQIDNTIRLKGINVDYDIVGSTQSGESSVYTLTAQSGGTPNGPVTYTWTLINKPGGSVASIDSSQTNATLPFTVDVPGDYGIEVVADDTKATSVPKYFYISYPNRCSTAFVCANFYQKASPIYIPGFNSGTIDVVKGKATLMQLHYIDAGEVNPDDQDPPGYFNNPEYGKPFANQEVTINVTIDGAPFITDGAYTTDANGYVSIDFGNLSDGQFSSGNHGVQWTTTYSRRIPSWGGYFNLNVSEGISISSIQVAQSAFLDNLTNTLVAGKPVMAQVSVASMTTKLTSKLSKEASTVVPVIATFTGPGTYVLGGCFNAAILEPGEPSIPVNLFELNGSQGFPFESGIFDLNVQVNPEGGVSGLPAGLTCGSRNQEGVAVNVPQNPNIPAIDPVLYSKFFPNKLIAKPSGSLEIDYVQLTPECAASGSGRFCPYNTLSNFGPYAQSETSLLKALYPISPAKAIGCVGVSNQSCQTSPSGGWSSFGNTATTDSKAIDKDRLEMCPLHAAVPKYDQRRCFFDYAVIGDMLRARESIYGPAGMPPPLPAKSPGKRIVGVVPSSVGGAPGYFSFLNGKYGNVYPGLVGMTYSHIIEDVSFVEVGIPIIVAHELGHSYRLEYTGNPSDVAHQSPGIHANGYWVTQMTSKSDVPSLMVSNAGFHPDAWMDLPTYAKLLDVAPFSQTYRAKDPSRAQSTGNEVFLNGFINQSGIFSMQGAFNGTSVGEFEGVLGQSLKLTVADPAGVMLNQSLMPIDFQLITEGVENPPNSSLLSPVSSGVSFPENAFSITIEPNLLGGRAVGSSIIFPAVEILKTALANIPQAAYTGNFSQQSDELSSVLDSVTALFSQGDIGGGNTLIASEFLPKISTSISPNYSKTSTLDTGLAEILSTTQSISTNLTNLSNSFPATSNGFIRVVPHSLRVSAGNSTSFSVVSLTTPQNPDLEFDLVIKLNGIDQSIARHTEHSWSYVTPALSVGEGDVKIQLVVQNRMDVDKLKFSISKLKANLIFLEKLLADTQDHMKIIEIEKQIGSTKNEISVIKDRIGSARTNAGAVLDFSISVN
jgi:hypothetical protein